MRKQLSYIVLFLYSLLSIAGNAASYAPKEVQAVQQDATISHHYAGIHSDPELGHSIQGHLYYSVQAAKKLSGSSALPPFDAITVRTSISSVVGHEERAVFCKAYLDHNYPTHNFW